MKARFKPTVFDAVFWTGKNIAEILELFGNDFDSKNFTHQEIKPHNEYTWPGKELVLNHYYDSKGKNQIVIFQKAGEDGFSLYPGQWLVKQGVHLQVYDSEEFHRNIELVFDES